MRTLDANDIQLIRSEVSTELAARLQIDTSRKGQPFGLEVLPELVAKVLLPIVVSVSARALGDLLQGKVLGSLTKKQADKLANDAKGAELREQQVLQADIVTELRRELSPLGMSDEDIEALARRVGQHVLSRGAAAS